MKKLFNLAMLVATAMACLQVSCVEPEPDPIILGDLAIEFESASYKVTLGTTSTIDFTVSGIGDAEIEVRANPKNNKWNTSAVIDSTNGKGVLTVTAPSELAISIVEIVVEDTKNNRSANKSISIVANAEGMAAISVAFENSEYSINAGGDAITLNYAVSELGAAILTTPVIADVSAAPLNVDNISYDSATACGTITLSCGSSVTDTSATVSFSVKDSFSRNANGATQVTITPIPPVEDSFNCYIVVPGEAKVFTKKYAEIVAVELAWQDEKGLISSLAVEGDNISVGTIADVKGNALVLGKNESGDVVWSWHIWVTDYNPDSDNITIDGVTFMTCNLGAISSQPGDIGALGNTYQWGRKDPFVRMTSKVTSGNAASVAYDIENNEIGTTVSNKYFKFKGTKDDNSISTTYQYPEYFFERFGDTNDWWGSGVALEKNLWGGEEHLKSVNDPCPKGWKVPIVTTDADGNNVNPYAFVETDATVVDTENAGLIYTTGGNSCWFPCTGLRYRTTGLAARSGKEGFYWLGTHLSLSGTKNMYDQMGFDVDGNKVKKATNYDGYSANFSGCAVAVRCVKEQ